MTRLTWTSSAANELAQPDASRAAEWNRLNASRLNLPFLDSSAIAAALAAFGNGKERLFIAHDEGRVVAMLVLVREGRWRWQTFQPSQIPLGAWVAEPGYSLQRLVRSLLGGPLKFCLALSITQVDSLLEPRGPDDASTEHADYIETGWVDIVGSFADYWAARGKNLRQNLRKQRNKLSAEGVTTRMQVLDQVVDMAPALSRYGALESSGWKAAEGTSIHPDNSQGRFYKQLFEDAARRGEALIFEYMFNERSVAMNLCLIRAGVLIVLKTTYDESIKVFSPASLLREEELQLFFAEGRIHRVEYYGRMMEWHTKLTDNKRGLYHLTAFRWPLLKQLAERRRVAISQSAPAEITPAAADAT